MRMRSPRLLLVPAALLTALGAALGVASATAAPAPTALQQPPQSGALTYATTDISTVSKQLTTAQLRQIYSCTLPPATQANFIPAIPRRTERIARTWIVDVLALPSPGPCVVETLNGVVIEENDLRAMSDQKMIIPVEIGVWMRQYLGPDFDMTGISRLNRLGGIDPLEPGPATRIPYWPPGS